jgi:hypothetical protein
MNCDATDSWTLADGTRVDVDRFREACPINVGPNRCPGWGWDVDHGHNGSMEVDDRTGRVTEYHAFLGDYESVKVVAGARWCAELVPDGRTANRVWRNRALISAALVGHLGERGAFEHAYRLSVTFDGARMTIREYDFGRFTLTVDAALK